jgi:hypothetical protein
MRLLAVAALLAVALAACASQPAPAAAPATPVPTPTFATPVVALVPATPAAIAHGPFEIRSINPGSDLVLSLAPGATCADDATWFAYSGGGVVVPAGHLLCARSAASGPVAHAFSGQTPAGYVVAPD